MSASRDRALRFVVCGTVQGVFFRDCTVRAATGLRLHGWVRNLADGSVEVVCRGEESALSELAGWLWQGSPASNVTSVEVEYCDAAIDDGFEVR